MSDLTKLFFHTGTTSPVDIGPATSGVLHSAIFFPSGGSDTATIRDGGSGGTVIAILHAQNGNPQFTWKGVLLTGQLNITLSNMAGEIVVEMSEVL